MERKNLAARAAHWSATHRKAAIFGWLAFVVVSVLVGNAVGQNKIQGADQFSGESGRAEQTLYSHGLRPNDEHVLFQSQTLTIKDPEFKSAIKETAQGLSDASMW
jgi:RND superfamily putative drug exporter